MTLREATPEGTVELLEVEPTSLTLKFSGRVEDCTLLFRDDPSIPLARLMQSRKDVALRKLLIFIDVGGVRSFRDSLFDCCGDVSKVPGVTGELLPDDLFESIATS